jgi:hypothetical protein
MSLYSFKTLSILNKKTILKIIREKCQATYKNISIKITTHVSKEILKARRG